MHKKKKTRRAPDPRKLAAVAKGLATPLRNGDDDDDEGPVKGKKRRKRDAKEARPRWQLGAWTPHTQKVLGYGKNCYKFRVVTEQAFPSDAQRTSFGQEAFLQAKEHESQDFNASSSQELDKWKLRVIADTSWGIRGHVKTLAIAQVVSGYGLERPRILGVARTKASAREAVAWTKDRVAMLLTQSAFILGPHNNVPEAKYMNSNISTLIRASIKSFGPDLQALFTPMPHATVALAAASLEMALRQWTTGRHIPVSIGPEDETVYRRHLKRLVNLRNGKINRYNNLMRAIAIDAFFYDNNKVDEERDEESDDLQLFGADSSDDEPAFE
jgi:hypothetical protein